MRDCNQRRLGEQFGLLKRQFLQEGELPFARVLSDATLNEALESISFAWKDCHRAPKSDQLGAVENRPF